MSIFFIPALISLLLKLYVLMKNVARDKISILFLSLIIVFALHNAVELFGYFSLLKNGHVPHFFRPYYVITIYLISYLLLHGLQVAGYINRLITSAVLSIATLLAGLIVFSNLIVEGHVRVSYTVTAIEGQYYSIFSAFIIISLIATTTTLIHGYKNANTSLQSQRCLYSLYALAPIILAFTIAIIGKITQINLTAAGIVPIATTLFLLIILKTESQHQLSDIRKFLPLSLEKKTSNNFMSILDHYMSHQNEENIFKTIQSNVEKEIISYSLEKCDYNVAKTTKMMGLKNRSTLYSMIKRHDINLKKIHAK